MTTPDLIILSEHIQRIHSLELTTIYNETIRAAMKLSGGDTASLLINTLEGWRYIAGTPLARDEEEFIVQTLLSDSSAKVTLETGKSILIDDTQQDQRWNQLPVGLTFARSLVSVPLIHKGSILGTLGVAHSKPDQFTQDHLPLLNLIGRQCATALINARRAQHVQYEQGRLQAMISRLPEVVLVFDQTGQVIVASDASFDLCGVETLHEMRQKTLDQLAETDDLFLVIRDVLPDALDDADQITSIEARSETNERDYLVNIAPWQTIEDGICFIITIKDVTTLRTLSRFKNQMLRLLSHDLRTPLVLIIGYADLLKMDANATDNTEHLEFTDGIIDAAERMDRLLDGMLRVDRIRSSPIELHEEVMLNDIVNEVIAEMAGLAKQQGIQLKIERNTAGIYHILGDGMLLKQAMNNIVSNAIKYTNSGGRVHIKTSTNNQRYYFTVTDTGVGIPEEDLPKIFEDFFRAGNADDTSTGMGIGLSLVKGIAQQHGGDVTAKSKVGVGSTFTLWLPLAELNL